MDGKSGTRDGAPRPEGADETTAVETDVGRMVRCYVRLRIGLTLALCAAAALLLLLCLLGILAVGVGSALAGWLSGHIPNP
ncbi:MAG TPA: hypothetical protein VFL91_18845 [Thermomicrobiales bacterium]|nr:hypothetical protein [Thermomicrobiales bacterium]